MPTTEGSSGFRNPSTADDHARLLEPKLRVQLVFEGVAQQLGKFSFTCFYKLVDELTRLIQEHGFRGRYQVPDDDRRFQVDDVRFWLNPLRSSLSDPNPRVSGESIFELAWRSSSGLFPGVCRPRARVSPRVAGLR